jgi:coenzyme PQQ precursor peptide PqqA
VDFSGLLPRLVPEGNRFARERNVRVALAILLTCAIPGLILGSTAARVQRRTGWENAMTWKTPKIVEVPVGMEINMYACAARK